MGTEEKWKREMGFHESIQTTTKPNTTRQKSTQQLSISRRQLRKRPRFAWFLNTITMKNKRNTNSDTEKPIGFHELQEWQ